MRATVGAHRCICSVALAGSTAKRGSGARVICGARRIRAEIGTGGRGALLLLDPPSLPNLGGLAHRERALAAVANDRRRLLFGLGLQRSRRCLTTLARVVNSVAKTSLIA